MSWSGVNVKGPPPPPSTRTVWTLLALEVVLLLLALEIAVDDAPSDAVDCAEAMETMERTVWWRVDLLKCMAVDV